MAVYKDQYKGAIKFVSTNYNWLVNSIFSGKCNLNCV